MPENQPPSMENEDELQVTMEEYGIDEQTAQAVLQARQQGFEEEEIVNYLQGVK